jgi:integrase
MAKQLTATAVVKLKPTASRQEIADAGAPGLRLIIQSSGAKSWAMRFRRPNGKTAKLTLGPLDPTGRERAVEPTIGQPLTLAGARALAAEIGRQRARDLDVVAEHRTEKRRRRAVLLERGANTFGRAAQEFIDDHKVARTGRKPRRWRETARLLGLNYPAAGGEPTVIRNGLSDRWRDKPIAEIDADDVYHVIDEARRSGVPGLGRRNRGTSDPRGRRMADTLGIMFKWLHKHRRIASNPSIGVYRPPPPPARKRALNCKTDVRNADELRWFWVACDALGQPFGTISKLLLLTGCRLKEIASMTRDELSDDLSMLRLPGVRTKNGLPHDVPLPPLARELIASAPQMAGCKFLFTTNGKTPVSGFSKYKKRLDAAMLAAAGQPFPTWKTHDLRHSCSTGMNGIGIPPHIVEVTINHISGAKGGVAGVYNHEEYEQEKRAALERWADYIAAVVSGRTGNVVPMRGRT